MQSGPGEMPNEELDSKKEREKKDFRIEGVAKMKHLDRLMVTTCNGKEVQQRTKAGEKNASKA